MILGIAARSSIATPIGPFRKFGDISVTNIAIPMAVGTAMRRARNVVTTVPKTVVAAPNDSLTGFQSVDVRNRRIPNFFIEREDSCSKTTKIPTTRRMMVNDATAVRNEKEKSTAFFL